LWHVAEQLSDEVVFESAAAAAEFLALATAAVALVAPCIAAIAELEDRARAKVMAAANVKIRLLVSPEPKKRI
jgi:hypothetical protein